MIRKSSKVCIFCMLNINLLTYLLRLLAYLTSHSLTIQPYHTKTLSQKDCCEIVTKELWNGIKTIYGVEVTTEYKVKFYSTLQDRKEI